MLPDPRSPAVLAEIAEGAEDLDRGLHGPELEIEILKRHGWLRGALPREFGGQGWGHGATGARNGFAALFMLGSVSLPITRIFEGHVNAVRLIDRYGTQAQRERVFDDVHGGALLAIWGADGDKPARTNAGSLVGAKTFASGLGEVAHAIATATDDGQSCQMVLVAAHDPARWNLAAWDVAAMVGTRSGEFTIDDLPASADYLLGAPNALFGEPDFNGGVWRLCAGYAGAMAAIAQHTFDLAQYRGGEVDARMRLRLGHVQHHAQTALLWAWHACRCVETAVADDDASVDRAVATTLFAREAIEQAAIAQMSLVERIAGTSLHRRGSLLGRMMRDFRFFLRQAALDAKLDSALAMRPAAPGVMLADVIDDVGLPDYIRGHSGNFREGQTC